MAKRTYTKLAAGMAALVVVTGICAGWYLWRAHQDNAISAGNTRFFQWARGEARDELRVNVQPNPQFQRNEIATMPTAPVGGRVILSGNPGTVAPGTIVQAKSRRGGETHTAIADEQGGLQLEMTVEAGDTPMIATVTPPEAVLSPQLDMSAAPRPH